MFKKDKNKKRDVISNQVNNSIIARIISDKEGLRVITGIKGIRVISDKYHLLIMADYVPTLGKVNGSIEIVTENEEILFNNIEAFYKLQHNEFTLLIDSQN